MKKTLLLASLFFAINANSQDITINQINNGFNYDASTGVLSGIYFDVMNTSDSDDAGSFKISIVLSDPSNPQTSYEAGNITINSLSASSSIPVSEWNIDLNNATETIPNGEYRVGVYVDSHGDISETDEDNNYYYISSQGNNINFGSEGGSSAGIVKNENLLFSYYPNPSNGKVSFTSPSFGLIQLFDLAGSIIYEVNYIGTTVDVDFSNLQKGSYILNFTSKNSTTSELLLLK